MTPQPTAFSSRRTLSFRAVTVSTSAVSLAGRSAKAALAEVVVRRGSVPADAAEGPESSSFWTRSHAWEDVCVCGHWTRRGFF